MSENVDSINVPLTRLQVAQLKSGQAVSVRVSVTYAATGEPLEDQPVVVIMRLTEEQLADQED